MVFDWLGPFEVLPEQLPANNDVQGCYAATIIRAMPIAEAHARFPKFQEQTPAHRSLRVVKVQHSGRHTSGLLGQGKIPE